MVDTIRVLQHGTPAPKRGLTATAGRPGTARLGRLLSNCPGPAREWTKRLSTVLGAFVEAAGEGEKGVILEHGEPGRQRERWGRRPSANPLIDEKLGLAVVAAATAWASREASGTPYRSLSAAVPRSAVPSPIEPTKRSLTGRVAVDFVSICAPVGTLLRFTRNGPGSAL